MKDEVWKPVKGYEGLYEVSNKGRVRSVERRDARGQLRKSKIMSVKKIQNSKKITFFRNGKARPLHSRNLWQVHS